MHLTWFGLTSFKIVAKDSAVFTDPFSKSTGATPPRGHADIVVCSDPDNELFTNLASLSGEPFVVRSPGEYDLRGVFIRGVAVGTDSSNQKQALLNRRAAYTFSLEGVTIGFLGHYPEKTVSEELAEEFEGVDVLLVPVGAPESFGAEAAAALANQLQPKVVIPMLYKIPGFTLPLTSVDQFLKEMGSKAEPLDKLVIKKADLETEKTRLVILSPQRG